MCFQESESKIIIEIKENKAHAVDVGVYQRPRRQELVELRCHGFQEVHDLKGVTLHDLCSIETFTHCLKHHYSLTDLRFIHGRWCMHQFCVEKLQPNQKADCLRDCYEWYIKQH
jgi:hypothetical protein